MKASATSKSRTAVRANRRTKRLMLYMFYDPHGVVAEYIPYKLEKFREYVDTIAVVCNGVLRPEGRAALEAVADQVHVRENKGFDVWAYRHGIVDVIGWDALAEYDELLLVNYTFYAPIFPLAELFGKMEAEPVDFWGITAYKGPVPNEFTGEGVIPYHIQSHFIAVRKPMLASSEFRSYWEKMGPIESYVDSILRHESRFTEHFASLGFRHGVYCDPAQYKSIHPVFEAVDRTLENRCPILKRRPFFHEPHFLDAKNVDLARALDIVRETSDYPLELIWKDITRVSKPRDLYTNATLMAVPEASGRPVKLQGNPKVAVLAHVFYPELLEEMLGYCANIPVPFDLYITTNDAERKTRILSLLEVHPKQGFKVGDVRVVENRGRDVSALVIGLRDVVLEGGYDYCCRIHSKLTPQNSEAQARHFKEHLFENLLESPGYVSRLLKCFEDEPRLGMLLPPVVHIGYPTLGHAWFANRAGAQEWARKLHLTVPFDDFTPLAVYGTMWWFRPEALLPLFEHPFRYSEFPAEPNHHDGGLAHILERLFVYVSHQQGFYAKCVLTPENAAKNYVKLEYKLQALIGNLHQSHSSQADAAAFPNEQLRRFLAKRLGTSPLLLRFVHASLDTVQKTYRIAKPGAPSKSGPIRYQLVDSFNTGVKRRFPLAHAMVRASMQKLLR